MGNSNSVQLAGHSTPVQQLSLPTPATRRPTSPVTTSSQQPSPAVIMSPYSVGSSPYDRFDNVMAPSTSSVPPTARSMFQAPGSDYSPLQVSPHNPMFTANNTNVQMKGHIPNGYYTKAAWVESNKENNNKTNGPSLFDVTMSRVARAREPVRAAPGRNSRSKHGTPRNLNKRKKYPAPPPPVLRKSSFSRSDTGSTTGFMFPRKKKAAPPPPTQHANIKSTKTTSNGVTEQFGVFTFPDDEAVLAPPPQFSDTGLDSGVEGLQDTSGQNDNLSLLHLHSGWDNGVDNHRPDINGYYPTMASQDGTLSHQEPNYSAMNGQPVQGESTLDESGIETSPTPKPDSFSVFQASNNNNSAQFEEPEPEHVYATVQKRKSSPPAPSYQSDSDEDVTDQKSHDEITEQEFSEDAVDQMFNAVMDQKSEQDNMDVMDPNTSGVFPATYVPSIMSGSESRKGSSNAGSNLKPESEKPGDSNSDLAKSSDLSLKGPSSPVPMSPLADLVKDELSGSTEVLVGSTPSLNMVLDSEESLSSPESVPREVDVSNSDTENTTSPQPPPPPQLPSVSNSSPERNIIRPTSPPPPPPPVTTDSVSSPPPPSPPPPPPLIPAPPPPPPIQSNSKSPDPHANSPASPPAPPPPPPLPPIGNTQHPVLKHSPSVDSSESRSSSPEPTPPVVPPKQFTIPLPKTPTVPLHRALSQDLQAEIKEAAERRANRPLIVPESHPYQSSHQVFVAQLQRAFKAREDRKDHGALRFQNVYQSKFYSAKVGTGEGGGSEDGSSETSRDKVTEMLDFAQNQKKVQESNKPNRMSAVSIMDEEWTPAHDLDGLLDDQDDEILTARGANYYDAISSPRGFTKSGGSDKSDSEKHFKKNRQSKKSKKKGGSIHRIKKSLQDAIGSIGRSFSKGKKKFQELAQNEEGWEIFRSENYDAPPDGPITIKAIEMHPVYAYHAEKDQMILLPDYDRVIVTDDGRKILEADLLKIEKFKKTVSEVGGTKQRSRLSDVFDVDDSHMSPREKEVQEQRRQQELMEVQFAHIRDLSKQLAKKGNSSVRAPGFHGFSDAETPATSNSKGQDYNAYSLDRALTSQKNRYKKSAGAETKPRHKVLLKGMDAYTQNLTMPNSMDTSDETPPPREHLNRTREVDPEDGTENKGARVSVISIGESEDAVPPQPNGETPKRETLNAPTGSRSSTIVSTADTASPGNEVSTAPVTFSELNPHANTQLLPPTAPTSQSSGPPGVSNAVPRLYPGRTNTQLHRTSSIIDSISAKPFRPSSAQPVFRAVKAPQLMTPPSAGPQSNGGMDQMNRTSQPSSPVSPTVLAQSNGNLPMNGTSSPASPIPPPTTFPQSNGGPHQMNGSPQQMAPVHPLTNVSQPLLPPSMVASNPELNGNTEHLNGSLGQIPEPTIPPPQDFSHQPTMSTHQVNGHAMNGDLNMNFPPSPDAQEGQNDLKRMSNGTSVQTDGSRRSLVYVNPDVDNEGGEESVEGPDANNNMAPTDTSSSASPPVPVIPSTIMQQYAHENLVAL